MSPVILTVVGRLSVVDKSRLQIPVLLLLYAVANTVAASKPKAESGLEQFQLSSGVEMVAASQPVSIEDMINGWDGDYYGGEMAFADAISYSQFSFSTPTLGRLAFRHQYRRYYYMAFSRDTADFYRAAETSGLIAEDKHLDLIVKHFEGPGIGLTYALPAFRLQEFDVSLAVTGEWYQPGHFQFGEVSGLAKAGATDQVAANIDYRYDQDKILDSNSGLFAVDDVHKGSGYSFSFQAAFDWERIRFTTASRDMINAFHWSNGAFTRGCVNVGGGVSGVCSSGQLQNGFYGNQSTSEQIHATHSLSLSEKEMGYQVAWLQHDRYQRYTLAKSFATKLGRFDVFLYHPLQLGLGWQYQAFKLRLASDTMDFNQARNLSLDFALGWQW